MQSSFKVGKRAITGLLIIAIGVIFLLGSLDVIDTGYIFGTYWPVILIVIGIANLLDRSNGSFFGLIVLLVGVFFQMKELGYVFEDVNLWNVVWPCIIILAGLWFIFPKKKRILNSDTIDATALFSGSNIINISQNFGGGNATAVFGGIDIDLRGSNIVADNVVLDTFVAFGGIDIKVPEGWFVEIKGFPLLGGWDNKHGFPRNGERPSKVLTVKCFIICGGLDVK